MVRNDYYNLNVADVREVVGMCEKNGVATIAIEGYEWLMHKGEIRKNEYQRLMELYRKGGNIEKLQRVKERYYAIYKDN